MEDKAVKIKELETLMQSADFWSDKVKAQATIKELNELKQEAAGRGKYDKGDAIMTILSGAGGDDAEDFSRILIGMYCKYFDTKGWSYSVVHKNENDNGGGRQNTMEKKRN